MKTRSIGKAIRICIPFTPQFVLLGIASAAMPLAIIATTLIFSAIAERYSERGTVDYGLAAYATATTFLWIFLRSIQAKENFKRIGYGLLGKLDVSVLKKLSSLSLSQVMEDESRREMIERGEMAVRDTISRTFTDVLPIISLLVTVISALFFVHWILALAVIACFVGFIWAGVKLDYGIFEKVKEYDSEENRIQRAFWECATNVRMVILDDLGEKTVKEYEAQYGEYARKGKALWLGHMDNVFWKRDTICFGCMTLILFLSLWLMRVGELKPSYFLAAMVWPYMAFNSMFSMGTTLRLFMGDWSRIEALVRFFETPSFRVTEDSVKLDRFDGIEVEATSFSHSNSPFDRRAVLEDVSFSLKPGSINAIVGPSGAGKSTLANVTIGALPLVSGRVLVSGKDLRDLDMRSFWKLIGFVEQRPAFFSTKTVEENIDYVLNGHAKDVGEGEKIELLRRLKLGHLYENGRFRDSIEKISGGERQRVAIARALIKNPKLLVLDEATSALDNETEAEVLKAIKEIAEEKGITVLAIAHRYTTATLADQVVYVKNGKVLAVGKHWDLMNKLPDYETLFFSEMLSARMLDEQRPQK